MHRGDQVWRRLLFSEKAYGATNLGVMNDLPCTRAGLYVSFGCCRLDCSLLGDSLSRKRVGIGLGLPI